MTEIVSPVTFTGRPAARAATAGLRGEDAATEAKPPVAFAEGADDAVISDAPPETGDAMPTGWVRIAAGDRMARDVEIEAMTTAEATPPIQATMPVPPISAETALPGQASGSPPSAEAAEIEGDQAAPSMDRSVRTVGETRLPDPPLRARPGVGEPQPQPSAERATTPLDATKPTLPGAGLAAGTRATAEARPTLSEPMVQPAGPMPGEGQETSAAPGQKDRDASVASAPPASRPAPVAISAPQPEAAREVNAAPRAAAGLERGPGEDTPEAAPSDRKAEPARPSPHTTGTASAPNATVVQVARAAAAAGEPGAMPAALSPDDVGRIAGSAPTRWAEGRASSVDAVSAPTAAPAGAVAPLIADPRRTLGARAPSAAEIGVRMAAAAAVGEDGQVGASDDGGDLGTFHSGMISPSGGGGAISVVVPVAHAGGAELARTVGDQLSVALSRRGRGTVELRLDPPELGKVRLTLGRGEHGVTASIVADRPEVADLLRRHADVLSQALTDAGQPRAELRFGGGAWSGAGGSGPESGAAGGGGPGDETAPQAARPPQPRVSFGPRDGLDLRV